MVTIFFIQIIQAANFPKKKVSTTTQKCTWQIPLFLKHERVKF